MKSLTKHLTRTRRKTARPLVNSLELMKIRELIQTRTRRFIALAVGSWLVFASSSLFGEGNQTFILELVGFLGFASAVIGIVFLVKCPRCGAKLGQLGVAQPFSMSGKQRTNFCPHCGVSFDEQAEF